MATCLGTSFNLESRRLQEVLEKAKRMALMSGISLTSVNEAENGPLLTKCAPFTLFPSVVPKPSLQIIKDCMKDFNRLMHKVANDHDFLETSLKNVLTADDFVRGLWNIYTKVREEGFTQPLSLGLFRNDFMLYVNDANHIQPKQIEFNTFAVSCHGLISPLIYLHRFTLDAIGKHYEPEQVPDNDPTMAFAEGMVKAWELYGNKKAVILFIVSSNDEMNLFDLNLLEIKTNSIDRKAKVTWRTYLDIYNRATLSSDKRLFIDKEEVSVVYLSSGYAPEDYPTWKEWDARLLIERSMAVKCSPIQYQLAETKKIQQELTRPGSLERFIKDEATVDMIRATFVKQHSMDLDPEGDTGVDLALANPQMYVLKPQREGGGQNLFDGDIKKFLQENLESSKRNAYILMERIFPPSQKNYLVKSGLPFVLSDVVNELSVFGVYIGSDTNELMNLECGHMLRTKTVDTDEGGVSEGCAVLDLPFLLDSQLLYQQYLQSE